MEDTSRFFGNGLHFYGGNMYRNNERVLRVRDLLMAAVCHWRRVLAVTLTVALLLGGGVGIFTALKANDAQLQQEANNDYQWELSAYHAKQKFLEADILQLRDYIAQQQTYLKESILMNMDPYSSFQASWSLYVSAAESESEEVLLAYHTALSSNGVLQSVAKEVNIAPKYLKELYHVTMNTDTDKNPSRFLTVTVRYPDAEGALSILEAMGAEADRLQKELNATLGNHKISYRHTGAICTVDLGLSTTQRAEASRLSQYESSLAASKEALDNLKEPKSEAVTVKDAGMDALFYCVIGLILGFAVSIVMECLIAACSNRVLSYRELETNTGIPMLGFISSGKKKGLEGLIRRKQGIPEENTPKSIALLTLQLESYSKDMHNLLITGNGVSAVENAIPRLGEKTLTFAENLLSSSKALTAIEQCDGVVLVAQRYSTRYADIEKALTYIADMDKTLVGCIMTDH